MQGRKVMTFTSLPPRTSLATRSPATVARYVFSLFLVCSLAFSMRVEAQEFPTKPITLINPFAPGGSTEVAVRAIADVASKKLGVPILLENKPGAGGAAAPGNMALTAKPDGYTLAVMPVGVFRYPLMQEANFKHDDFTYIIHLTGYVFAVVSNNTHGFKTWDDLIKFAKANPGKLTYGTAGVGTSPHLGMERLMDKAGIKLTHVPYKGGGEAFTALLGGHVDLNVGGGGIPRELADEGKIRFLNVWTANPLPKMPNVPTLKQLGYDLVINSPFGIAGPKGIPPEIVAKLHDALKAGLEDPSTRAAMEKIDMVPNYMTSVDYRKSVDQLVANETDLLKRLGLYKK